MDGKVCKKCSEYKSPEHFHKHARCKQGLNTVCKQCRKPISTKQWAETPLEYKIWTRAKSRATIKNREFNIEVTDIVVPKFCPVLGVPLTNPSIDRIDSSKGYVKGNIRIISTRANVLKNNATIWELERVLEDLRKL